MRVAIANNNIENPFAPFGNGNLLQAAWLAGLVRRAVAPARRRALLGCHHARAGGDPGRCRGMDRRAGAEAHLALLDTEESAGVALRAPAVLATMRGGRLVHTLAGPAVEA